MQCKVSGSGSGSVKVRYLPDYLTNKTNALLIDQALAMSIFARQQAEKEYANLKTELAKLKSFSDEADKERYKAEKKHFDILIYHHVINSGYFNAARIRFAYAMTVHRGQGREWSHVILNAERSSSGTTHNNDGYFRYLYTAATCSSDKLSLQKYPLLNPLSRCTFKTNSQCKIAPFNIAKPLCYNHKRVPTVAEAKLIAPRGLTNGTPELVALLLTLTDRLDGSSWQIESIAQHAYQEHYTFINALEKKVLARLSYKGNYTVSNITWVADDVDPTKLQDLQKRIHGNDVFEAWEVKEAVTSLDELLLPADFTRNSVKENAYRAQVGFNHPQGTVELEINVNKKGLVSSIRPLRVSNEKIISVIQQLVEAV